MPAQKAIIDFIRRNHRDDYFLKHESLREEITKYLVQACREILPDIHVELNAEKILASEKRLVDQTTCKAKPAAEILSDSFSENNGSATKTHCPMILFIFPMQGPVTANRILDLLQGSQKDGLHLSAACLQANRHPAWQLQGEQPYNKDYMFYRRPLKHIGARQDLPEHLRTYLPNPKDIKGSQYLPKIMEIDYSLLLLKGKPKSLENPNIIFSKPDMANAPLAFRLPVFNLDK
jgi:hypothetical protein